jgi:hypothetical protein
MRRAATREAGRETWYPLFMLFKIVFYKPVSHRWSVVVFVIWSFFWIISRNYFHFQWLFCVGFYVPMVMLLESPSALEYQAKKSLNLLLTALRSFNCPPLFTGFHNLASREIKIFENHFIYNGGCFTKLLLFCVCRSFHTQRLKMILRRKVRKKQTLLSGVFRSDKTCAM